MLSRVAENIYWLGRYLERVENVARFIDVNIHLMLDLGPEYQQQIHQQWAPLITASGDEKHFKSRYQHANEESVTQFLVFDTANRNSILSCTTAARDNAKQVKDAIPTELWEQINQLYQFVSKYRLRRNKDMLAFLQKVKQWHHIIIGMTNAIMSHDEGWHFIRLGRFIERADKTSRILDVKYYILLPNWDYVDSPLDAVQWGALLKSVSAFEMYRKCYHRINFKNVADYLIFNEHFPRSLRYCSQQAKCSFHAVVNYHPDVQSARQELSERLCQLDEKNIDSVIDQGLHQFIDAFQGNLNEVDKAINKLFFRMDHNELIQQQIIKLQKTSLLNQ